MSSPEFARMLDGPAAAFKGGRDYVHGSDIVAFAARVAGEVPSLAFLRRIEFHRPLTSRGVLFVRPQLAKSATGEFAATGSYSAAGDEEVPFVVFAAPLPVLRTDLPFDEEALWPRCELDTGRRSVRTTQGATQTFEEHLTSMMKLLCRTVVPAFGKWWFVRLTRNGETPAAGTELELRVRRLTADRFVTAGILADGQAWGTIEFIGRQE